jgi:hypothetical protein
MSAQFWFRAQRPAARLGLKGPDAPRLLQQAGVVIPEVPNAISRATGHGGLSRCLRLGHTEFLLEQDSGDDVIERLRALAAADPRARPVLRCDYSVLLGGSGVFDALSRICSFDCPSLLSVPHTAVMTLAAGISVTLALDSADGADRAAPALRLWTDASYGTYFEQTLRSLSSPSASSHGEPP